jgi:hypothetical protein
MNGSSIPVRRKHGGRLHHAYLEKRIFEVGFDWVAAGEKRLDPSSANACNFVSINGIDKWQGWGWKWVKPYNNDVSGRQKRAKKDPEPCGPGLNYLLWSLRNLTEESPATNHQNTTLR